MSSVPNFPRLREFTDAREFIDALRPTNEAWTIATEWKSRWVFRGQSDGSLPLLPRAWRQISIGSETSEAIDFIQHHKGFNATIHDLAFQRIIKSWPDGELEEGVQQNMFNLLKQVFAEVRSIADFIEIADVVGHDIDKIDPNGIVENYLYKFRKLGDHHNDKIWMEDIVALAQHHGIPTRLLDWTSNPLVAAFFATEGVTLDAPSAKTNMAVFALDSGMIGRRIQLKRVPRSKNAYLHAQSGLFSYDGLADSWYIAHGSWPTLEEALLQETEEISRQSQVTEVDFVQYLAGFQKFTLPVAEAGEVLRLLWIENVSRAHLMPTLDNVVLALKKQMYWAEKQNPKRVNRTD